jgi:chromate transport protein ChrA
VFCRFFSVGGGISVVPDIHWYLVIEHGWITQQQFTSSVALAQVAPGPNVLFVALMGRNVGANAGSVYLGALGAVLCLFGLVLPRLGMFLSLPLLVLIASYAGDEFHIGEVAINSLVLTVFSWAIFIWGLNLTIPLWPSFLGAR